MENDVVIQQLVQLGWSKEQIELGKRANWKCEYCGIDLLEDPDTYASWQVDHLIPVNDGGSGAFDNLAIACRNCNCVFKNRWSPRSQSETNRADSRDVLITDVKEYVLKKREEYKARLATIRELVKLLQHS